jgi:hypothetical protein
MSAISNQQDTEKPSSIRLAAYGKPPAQLAQFGALLGDGSYIRDTLASLKISHASEHILDKAITQWSEMFDRLLLRSLNLMIGPTAPSWERVFFDSAEFQEVLLDLLRRVRLGSRRCGRTSFALVSGLKRSQPSRASATVLYTMDARFWRNRFEHRKREREIQTTKKPHETILDKKRQNICDVPTDKVRTTRNSPSDLHRGLKCDLAWSPAYGKP